MRGRKEERIEAAIDHIAAAVFGLAAGWIGYLLMDGMLVAAGAAAVVGYLVAARLLRGVQAVAPTFEVRAFRPRDLELSETDELLLTEQVELLLTEQVELVLTEKDRLKPAQADVLVLDDILAELGPGSRVVRLFDPAAMPTPGQLNARIEQHLHAASSPAAPQDASQALHDALAELRRSLR